MPSWLRRFGFRWLSCEVVKADWPFSFFSSAFRPTRGLLPLRGLGGSAGWTSVNRWAFLQILQLALTPSSRPDSGVYVQCAAVFIHSCRSVLPHRSGRPASFPGSGYLTPLGKFGPPSFSSSHDTPGNSHIYFLTLSNSPAQHTHTHWQKTCQSQLLFFFQQYQISYELLN